MYFCFIGRSYPDPDNHCFISDLPLLLPLCHVICLLGVLEMKRNNWVQVIALLTSLLTTVENSLIELKVSTKT